MSPHPGLRSTFYFVFARCPLTHRYLAALPAMSLIPLLAPFYFLLRLPFLTTAIRMANPLGAPVVDKLLFHRARKRLQAIIGKAVRAPIHMRTATKSSANEALPIGF